MVERKRLELAKVYKQKKELGISLGRKELQLVKEIEKEEEKAHQTKINKEIYGRQLLLKICYGVL